MQQRFAAELPKLDQTGLQAVYEDLCRAKPEIEVTFHSSYLLVTNHPESSPYPRFCAKIRDCRTPSVAEFERDDLRRLIKEAAIRQGMADPE
ncbi:MAG: hypothetical protein K8U57_00390, partial [Planctomycetes bacterium]|nr:hypothetical protein [Planctomycetota bacterium]